MGNPESAEGWLHFLIPLEPVKQATASGPKLRHMPRGRVPNDRVVHGEVGMRQHIAKSGNLAPRDGRFYIFEILRQTLDCFPNDFELPDYGITRLGICLEPIGIKALNIARDQAASFDDVFQAQLGIT